MYVVSFELDYAWFNSDFPTLFQQKAKKAVFNEVHFIPTFTSTRVEPIFNMIKELETILTIIWKKVFKKCSGTGVFLWILQNFEEHIFLENMSGLTNINKYLCEHVLHSVR